MQNAPGIKRDIQMKLIERLKSASKTIPSLFVSRLAIVKKIQG